MKVGYGINWANVRKRYISQLIAKGFYHHHWNTRIVAVLQAELYESFRKFIQFDELEPKAGTANIVFMLYRYVPAPDKADGAHRLVLDRVVGTSHNSLMMGSLYQRPPPKERFCERILATIDRKETAIPLVPPPEGSAAGVLDLLMGDNGDGEFGVIE